MNRETPTNTKMQSRLDGILILKLGPAQSQALKDLKPTSPNRKKGFWLP